MSWKNWIIGVGAVTLAALLGIWNTLTHIGSFLIANFPASILEQIGNADLGAFVMVIFVAVIIMAVILYIREKVNHTYYFFLEANMSKKSIPNPLLVKQLKIIKGKGKSKQIIGYQRDCGENLQPIYSDGG